MHSFLLGIYLGAIRSSGNSICNWGTARLFSKGVTRAYIPLTTCMSFGFSASLPTSCYYLTFLIPAIPVDVTWNLLVIWFVFPWWLVVLKHFFMYRECCVKSCALGISLTAPSVLTCHCWDPSCPHNAKDFVFSLSFGQVGSDVFQRQRDFKHRLIPEIDMPSSCHLLRQTLKKLAKM